MQDDRLSKTDELAEILDEYRKQKKNEAAMAATRVSDMKTRIDVANLSGDTPVRIEGTDGEEEHTVPSEETVAAHFADSVSAGDIGVSSHFTESGEDEPSFPDEADGEEEEEAEDTALPLPLKLLKKIGNAIANASFLLKAVLYIAVVLIIAAYLSYYVLTIGNDVFALVTGDTEITVKIPENATEEYVTELLYENGLIDYKWVFSAFLQYYGDGEAVTFISGEHTLNTSMNYSQMLTALTTAYHERTIVTLTFPEGFTVDEIIDLFVENGIGTREGFVEAINEYPYKHEFVQLLGETGWDEDRVYRLEGYLYPDTYDFYTDTEEYLAINKLLNNFNEKVWIDWKSTYGEYCEAQGFSLDDIVTLSSMIEAEGKTAEDFEYISYVFRNRLSHSADFPLLESDATIQYAFELAGLERVQDSSELNISFESPYNTYLYEGLPPGAICNAGLDAILAAMYPSPPLDEDGDEINAYFFVSNNAGETYYASTVSGHERNKQRVQQENEAMKNNGNE